MNLGSIKNTLVFRADGGTKIGYGHVMRCLALAQAWQSQTKGEALFLTHGSVDLAESIKQRGCRVIPIENPYPHKEDLRLVHDTLGREKDNVCWIVVDGYHFDYSYLVNLKKMDIKVLIIDDMAQISEFPVSMVLNQNMYGTEIMYHGGPKTKFMLGTEYTLLRSEFSDIKKRDTCLIEARNILVTLGGADSNNYTSKVLEALDGLDDVQFHIKVVAGPANVHLDNLKNKAAKMSCRCEVFSSVTEMASLMNWADLVITAGGSTCLEVACMGVPMLVGVVAENQVRVVKSFTEQGCALSCGWYKDLNYVKFIRDVKALLHDPDLRRTQSRNGRRLVDGQGAQRVVKKMVTHELTLRIVTEKDSMLLWEWANDPIARQASFQSQPITLIEHEEWFAEKLADSNNLLLIAQSCAGDPVGLIRYKIMGKDAIVSVNLSKKYRGLGLGKKIINEGSLYINEMSDNLRIKALIKTENMRSINAFVGAGFRETKKLVYKMISSVEMQYNSNSVNEYH